ncbi:hypothetical protein [Methylobacterium radiotolerans]|uniref:Uncharacterized protein n=1 Tax=Methylobacterium radiotolerans (strain ATCC 27329 / DSM 1819 / JCM 2831 / NBRC 15690 / NCIMB 10815 / 0-1) TaxID=426355 RepID=B1M2M2_METRJ|nr:hypothetical protein [Methylobacterium radiotolerans]ACB27670.1 conserved hypothetical protein [Methylobacterium radiotolerans JCM 2831]GEM95887.1 hypothetical protein MRA01_04270 [Methylobacterium radiotolerans]
MLTASQARDETLPKLSALVRLAQSSMGSKMAAYDAVGRRIGASGSWVRKFMGRQDTGLDGHVLHNIRAAYERLCSNIEAAADAAEATNALLREDLHAALRADRPAAARTPGGAPAAGAAPRRPGRAAASALVRPDARPRVPGLSGAGDLTDLPLWRAANEEE